VKITKYFVYMRQRSDRAIIPEEWISRTVEHPQHTEKQSDGRIRKWAWIPEAEKYLRVILLDDEETVHNAFFDRSYKEKTK